jgi:hypothetical protein
MLFQKFAAKLFDRSLAIIHWEVYCHAVLVRLKIQSLALRHLLVSVFP